MLNPRNALRAVGGNVDSPQTPFPNIPAVPAMESQSATNFMASVKSWLEKASGSGLSGLATRGDLANYGVLETQPDGGFGPVRAPSALVPPVPTGLNISGAFTNMLLDWDNPHAAYGNHSYTEVWASETSSFSAAVLIGESSGAVFAHAVGEGSTRHYWIRFVSTSDVKGPFSSVNGLLGNTAVPVDFLMDTLTDEYGDVPFYDILTPTVIGGVAIPAGRYMKAAFIREASIVRGMIEKLAVDDARIANLTADKIKFGEMSGGRADVDSLYAYLARITNAYIDEAHIKVAGIKTALIDDAAITNAKIKDLAVDSIKIAGHSVTTSQSLVENDIYRGGYAGVPPRYSQAIHAYSGGTPQAVIVFFSLKLVSCMVDDWLHGATGTINIYVMRNGVIVSNKLSATGYGIDGSVEEGGFFIDTSPGYDPYYQIYTPYTWDATSPSDGHQVTNMSGGGEGYIRTLRYNQKLSVLTTLK